MREVGVGDVCAVVGSLSQCRWACVGPRLWCGDTGISHISRMFFDPMMTNINKHDCFQNHITIIRPERRSFHKCGAQMGFLQLPAASLHHGDPRDMPIRIRIQVVFPGHNALSMWLVCCDFGFCFDGPCVPTRARVISIKSGKLESSVQGSFPALRGESAPPPPPGEKKTPLGWRSLAPCATCPHPKNLPP